MRSSSKSSNRTRRRAPRGRRLWNDAARNTPSLGCLACTELGLCGGLQVDAAVYDCLQFCCGNPEACDRVCRNHPDDFVDRVREIGTFWLETVPRAPVLSAPELPDVIPVVYHGTRRNNPIESTVALSLYQMIDRQSGLPRFDDHAALCKAFTIKPGTTIVLTGTDRDPPLERWWRLGEASRRTVIRALKSAGVELVTTPNYSLFLDRPRWDDLHAMKRIAIVHEEFLREGMPAALHVNSRTETDFRRWTAYVADRPEITHVAYEFATGARYSGRREQHATWLTRLAGTVNRPLQLVMRGGTDVIAELAAAFSGVSILETSIFMKTVMRQRAYAKDSGAIGWEPAPTATGMPLDDLFAGNRVTVEARLKALRATLSNEGTITGNA